MKLTLLVRNSPHLSGIDKANGLTNKYQAVEW